MTNTREEVAVAKAIAATHLHGMPMSDCVLVARAAIEASDARFVPMLVEALRDFLEDTQHKNHNCGDAEHCPVIRARNALSQLPEEMRG